MDREGLQITRKGKKESNNCCPVKLFVAIAYQKGVIMCDQWDPNTAFLGIHYKEFVKNIFLLLLNAVPTRKTNLSFKIGAPYTYLQYSTKKPRLASH